MAGKIVNYIDLPRSQFENQFSVSPSDPLLAEANRILFITEINAPGAWTIDYTNISERAYTKTGTGHTVFLIPMAVLPGAVFGGVSNISGFFQNKRGI